MEDNRDNLVVIVAGYPDLMNTFLQSNPGLQSRFNTFINFEDYRPSELQEIFLMLCKENDYSVNPGAMDFLCTTFEDMYNRRDNSFSNGRAVRNYFENTVKRHANRIAAIGNVNDSELQTFILDDLRENKS